MTSKEVHSNYLDIRINENSGAGWRITHLYGEPSGDRKHLTWEYLHSLHNMIDLPWIMVEDFNEILVGSEKEGGDLRLQRSMQAFRDALDDCNLFYLGFVGDIFTWRRGRIREILDPTVCDRRWSNLFSLTSVTNEDFSKSYHRAIIIDT